MFPLNRSYIFHVVNGTQPIPQHMSPYLVNDTRSIEPTDF